SVVGPLPILERAHFGLVGVGDLDAQVVVAAPAARHRAVALAHGRHHAAARLDAPDLGPGGAAAVRVDHFGDQRIEVGGEGGGREEEGGEEGAMLHAADY